MPLRFCSPCSFMEHALYPMVDLQQAQVTLLIGMGLPEIYLYEVHTQYV